MAARHCAVLCCVALCVWLVVGVCSFVGYLSTYLGRVYNRL